MSLSINAQARREVEDINQPSSFKYSMRLVLIGESNLFSGKCICKMTGEQFSDGLSSSVYLFWEGNEYILRQHMRHIEYRLKQYENGK